MKINFRNILIVIVAVLCILAFFIFAALTNAISLPDIPASFLGAAAGAVITAVVTLLLLQGQSRAEELKERNVAVFKDKSDVFKKFIAKLWETWSDHELSSEEYWTLTSMFYQELMLYLDDKSQESIGNALSEMGDYLDEKFDETKNEKGKDVLRNNIVKIIDVLIGELHLGGKIDIKLFEKLDERMEVANKTIIARKDTTFKMLGIEKGTVLTYKHDNSITCITADESSKVNYRGEILSISKVATDLNDGKSAPGFGSFTIDGKKTLWQMRIEMEKKG